MGSFTSSMTPLIDGIWCHVASDARIDLLTRMKYRYSGENTFGLETVEENA